MAQKSATSSPLWGPALLSCWRGKCPRCHEGVLFSKRFRLRDDCESCGLVFRKDGGMTGQMYVSAAVTEVFALAILVVIYLATDWSTAVSLTVGLSLVVVFSYWLLPRSMAFWVGVEYATDTANERHAQASFEQSEKSRKTDA